MSVNLEKYREMLKQPWGKIMYQLIFAQLGDIRDQRVLDFGAGFGITASHLAKNNQVTAIEPNADLLYGNETTSYTKLLGSLDVLKTLDDNSFDLIICHNVLEYIPLNQHASYLTELERLLVDGGRLSLIKHNDVGKVIHETVFNNDIPTALDLLAGHGNYKSVAFSQGKSYSLEELSKNTNLKIIGYKEIRTLYALQPNSFKTEDNWLDNLIQIELAICDKSPYKDIAFFHHVSLEHGK